MEKENFNPNDSIRTIENALNQAKTEKTGAFYYYILWGTLLSIHYGLLFFTTKFPEYKNGFLETITWSVFPIGGLLSYLRSKKDDKTETALPLNEKVFLYGFGGFALAFGVIFIASSVQQPSLMIALFPLLLGFTVFVIGGVTKDKVSLIGGVLGMIITGISLNTVLEYQFLLASLASVVACLLPGILMKNSYVQ
jgi:Ca2+/Na+ antiporter